MKIPAIRLSLFLVSIALASLGARPASAQAGTGGFRYGDLYLNTVVWTVGSDGTGGIVRIDPLSGQATLLHAVDVPSTYSQAIAYDPWRDRVLFFGGFVPNTSGLWATDAAGNLEDLGLQTVGSIGGGLLTPRGDGLVYLVSQTNFSTLSYLDASNQLHVLQNATGTGPYDPGTVSVNIMSMVYVPEHNCLVGAYMGLIGSCPGVTLQETAIHRLDLSPDGTRVLSETCLVYDSDPTNLDGEPRGMSLGPDGDPILVLGYGGGGSGNQGRIVRIDLATNTATAYAVTNFFAQHRIVGGTYSRVRDQVLVHDSFQDALRAFSEGDVGGGTLFSGGLSESPSTGERAALVEVSSGQALTGLTATVPSVSLSAGGSQSLQLDVGPAHAGAIHFAVGSASGFAPGLDANGQLLPLNFDAYFAALLANPNLIPLLGSLGVLDAQGQTTVTFQLPAGTDPGLAGLILHHAATILSPALTVQRTTNAVPVELVP